MHVTDIFSIDEAALFSIYRDDRYSVYKLPTESAYIEGSHNKEHSPKTSYTVKLNRLKNDNHACQTSL